MPSTCLHSPAADHDLPSICSAPIQKLVLRSTSHVLWSSAALRAASTTFHNDFRRSGSAQHLPKICKASALDPKLCLGSAQQLPKWIYPPSAQLLPASAPTPAQDLLRIYLAFAHDLHRIRTGIAKHLPSTYPASIELPNICQSSARHLSGVCPASAQVDLSNLCPASDQHLSQDLYHCPRSAPSLLQSCCQSA